MSVTDMIARGHCVRPWCPSCGVFGRKAARRARETHALATERFHDHLARATRAEDAARRKREFLAAARRGDISLMPWQQMFLEATLFTENYGAHNGWPVEVTLNMPPQRPQTRPFG